MSLPWSRALAPACRSVGTAAPASCPTFFPQAGWAPLGPGHLEQPLPRKYEKPLLPLDLICIGFAMSSGIILEILFFVKKKNTFFIFC